LTDFEFDKELEVTEEMLSNFSTDISDYFDSHTEEPSGYDTYTSFTATEDDYKTIEDIRREREDRKKKRKREARKERGSKFINSFMPMAALLLLVSTVTYMSSLQFGLAITYNNQTLGMVENAEVIEEAASIIDSRIINKSLDSLEDQPQYKVAVVSNPSDFKTSTELSRSIIANDSTLTDNVCGVFADGDFVGAVTTNEAAQKVLDEILSEQKEEFAADNTKVESVEFNSSLSLETGVYASDSIVTEQVLKERLINNIDLSYKVEVVEEKNVKLRYKTEYVVDESKSNNYEQVTAKGQIGKGVAVNRVTYIDGIKISEENISVKATKKPVNEIITISPDNENAIKAKAKDIEENTSTDSSTDKDTDNEASEKNNTNETNNSKPKNSQFIWPAPTCGYITNNFGYQGEKLHKGVDISDGNAQGQPFVAAASGYVTTVVFDYGSENYGCYLIIDHGNGYQTLYAQCSDIYTTPGAYVEQGEVIGAIGSTGDSTGAHLHFEIRENGEYVDPANYLY